MRKIQTAGLRPHDNLTANERNWVYNGLDCAVTLEIVRELRPLLDNVSRATYEFSKSLQAPVLEMTIRGLLVDQPKRFKVLDSTKKKIATISYNLDRIIAEGIGIPGLNWRSNQQLLKLFYEVMALPKVRKRNANGEMAPTVNRDALERLSQYLPAEPLVAHLLALRDLDKRRMLLETGIDADGRFRYNFNIAGTNTGRLASSVSDYGTGSNIQNIDRELRSIFVSDPGWKFANLDLEQGDARNVGAICWNLFVESHGERFAGSYLDACESGDLHTTNAKLVWPDLGWTGVLKEDKKIAEQIFYRQDSYRQMTKKGGHGTNYYGTPATMAMHLKVQKGVIDDFQRRYFAAHPAIGSYERDPKLVNWHTHVRATLRDYGHITTMLGRRRYFFGRWQDDETLRAAIAYEPQSLTADEIDQGMLQVWRSGRPVLLMCQVHDSLLMQYREEMEDEIVPWLLEKLRVPMVLARDRPFCVPTEAKIGWNWGDHGDNNPDGLMKWTGQDKRRRAEPPRKLSLHHL